MENRKSIRRRHATRHAAIRPQKTVFNHHDE